VTVEFTWTAVPALTDSIFTGASPPQGPFHVPGVEPIQETVAVFQDRQGGNVFSVSWPEVPYGRSIVKLHELGQVQLSQVTSHVTVYTWTPWPATIGSGSGWKSTFIPVPSFTSVKPIMTFQLYVGVPVLHQVELKVGVTCIVPLPPAVPRLTVPPIVHGNATGPQFTVTGLPDE